MQPLVFFLSIAVFGSLWLPWLQIAQPFGGPPASFVPWEILESIFDPPQGRAAARPSDVPPLLLAFFSSFFVAALAVVMSVFSATPRILVLIAGATPFAVIIWAVTLATAELDRNGMQASDLFDGARMVGIDARSFEQLLTELGRVLGLGAYLHYIGALALLILGITMPGKTAANPLENKGKIS